ncbi:MAG: hypothetical protein J7539_14920 [Niabella sp.]|nr:hypothetical protein [Niabella sp.]
MRFIGISLLFLGIFLIPGPLVHACTMHQEATTTTGENKDNPDADKKMDCCKHKDQGAKHQHNKGNCDDNNCTNNNCHPMSVSSLHVVHMIEVAPPATSVPTYVVKPNDHPLTAHTYTIWQPPRLG